MISDRLLATPTELLARCFFLVGGGREGDKREGNDG